MQMQGWQVSQLGEPAEVLRLTELDVPRPGAGQVGVEVLGCALNFPDVLLVRGQYQDAAPLPFTPGIEICGRVTAVGDGVEGFGVGDRVMGGALLPAGGLAEHALADPRLLRPAPPGLDDARAAAFTVAYQTGWMALVHRAKLQPGETLLVHAAAGGVGSAAIAIGKAIGARVVGVVGGAEKAAVAAELGADAVIDRHAIGSADNLVPALKEALGTGGADVVYDPVGGDAFVASTKVMAFEGRLVVIGFAGGTVPKLAVNHALVKNYTVIGLLWGAYRFRAPQLVDDAWTDLDRLLAAGMNPPYVSRTSALSQGAAELTELAEGRVIGRVVVGAAG